MLFLLLNLLLKGDKLVELCIICIKIKFRKFRKSVEKKKRNDIVSFKLEGGMKMKIERVEIAANKNDAAQAI